MPRKPAKRAPATTAKKVAERVPFLRKFLLIFDGATIISLIILLISVAPSSTYDLGDIGTFFRNYSYEAIASIAVIVVLQLTLMTTRNALLARNIILAFAAATALYILRDLLRFSYMGALLGTIVMYVLYVLYKAITSAMTPATVSVEDR